MPFAISDGSARVQVNDDVYMLLQLDLKGSAAVVLHACFHVKDDQYVFVFAAMGDTEVRVASRLH